MPCMKKRLGMIVRRGWRVFRKWGPAFMAGVLFAVLCFLGLNAAMEPVSTNAFCGTACHEMRTAYRSWELSVHGANASGITVDCIDCHLPPKEHYFTHLTAKAYAGAKDMYMHHFGPPYDVEAMREEVAAKMANETCVHCHDNLLFKPSSVKARFAHLAALKDPEAKENRCIECHMPSGHNRTATIFSASNP